MIIALLEPARIQMIEAARGAARLSPKLDLDPAELARVEERLAAIHDDGAQASRRVRKRCPHLLAETEARLAALAEADGRRGAGEARHGRREGALRRAGRTARVEAQVRRAPSSRTASPRRCRSSRWPAAGSRSRSCRSPHAASHGLRARGVPRRRAIRSSRSGRLSRVASGGELSRIALAIQVVTSEVGEVPTLMFDEVDIGIGGAVAATVGRLLQALGQRAPGAVRHASAAGRGACRRSTCASRRHARRRCRPRGRSSGSTGAARVDELARMLAGSEITAKTRAHAKELLEQHRRHAWHARLSPAPAGARSAPLLLSACWMRRLVEAIRRPPACGPRSKSVLEPATTRRAQSPACGGATCRPRKAAFGVADVASGRSMTLDDVLLDPQHHEVVRR